MDSRKPLTAGELEIDCGAFGKIRRASPPAKGDFAIKDGRLTLLGCIQRGLVTLSREELLPFLDAMDAQDAQIQTLNERIIELDLEAMEKCRRIDSLLTPPPDAAVREAVNENRLHEAEQRVQQNCFSICARYDLEQELRIALASLRAVHAPRLTPEQVEAVKLAETLITDTMSDYGDCEHDVGHCICKYHSGVLGLRSAFPDAFEGEVGNEM
jgi:hypothetical protein